LADQPDLRKGETATEWVAYLEQTLEYRGYLSGGASGAFDDNLEQSVKSFQEASGLSPDGFVGPKTWDALTTEQPAETGTETSESTGRRPVIDWPSQFPEIYAISQHQDIDDYLRNVADIDPDALKELAEGR
jgi:peptidoglycan hydrolase-like protein with peptidoglycan-binding domain